MREDFSGVTEKDLARLFPVLLQRHSPLWGSFYAREALFLQSVFGNHVFRMNHIGSTAVPGLLAKPTVDILLELCGVQDLSGYTEVLLNAGYVVNTPPADIILYIKGYTPKGFCGQAFHVHVRAPGDWGELYFRDYLQTHPACAREYARLKQALLPLYRNDRDGYTAAKEEFVNKVTQQARLLYGGRYAVK